MLEVELGLRNGLACDDVSLEMLLDSLSSTDLEIVGVKTLNMAVVRHVASLG